MKKIEDTLAFCTAFSHDVVFPVLTKKELRTKYRTLAIRDIAERIGFGILPWAIIAFLTLSQLIISAPLSALISTLLLISIYLFVGRIRRNRTLFYLFGFLSYLLIVPFALVA